MTFNSKIKQAKTLIKEYLDKYPGKCAVANSFGKDSMVLFHLAWSVNKDIPVVCVMTPFKFPATYLYRAKMMKKYKMDMFGEMRNPRGDKPEWWKTDPNSCCNYYKVKPMGELLEPYDCWFAGLR